MLWCGFKVWGLMHVTQAAKFSKLCLFLTQNVYVSIIILITTMVSFPKSISRFVFLTLQRGVTGTARMLHALTHSSISRQVREQM